MLRKLLLALSIALAAALPVRAQETGGFWSEPPDQLFGAALESPYAQALLKRFAAAVHKDGDQACLQAKALDDAALAARGQALLRRHGVQMAKLMDENFDRAAYLAALSASAPFMLSGWVGVDNAFSGSTPLIASLLVTPIAKWFGRSFCVSGCDMKLTSCIAWSLLGLPFRIT